MKELTLIDIFWLTLLGIIVNVTILSPVLWLAGRAIAGKEEAKFKDAILKVVILTVVGALFGISSQA